ncbi:hypothetical protein COV24_00790 [candidate division WWE3 bacterium CG10_big_fil_rev_8_21_14_0_10_32_10]|uniref:tRNA-specific 2-thiouridylase MnmA n=1 Tax=candidate division WWE3 bacterium CG10_big_fil_rev_8_21_14_0_10_32_10 TaxID=1975090 RepID=A0A2H0RB47_UNCKA|nr:MAG: hypothetical protein COV24_00790 [candidate division WWE3 bacterium CG10_big_fil_rev_8_21_14_0_10_32_10]
MNLQSSYQELLDKTSKKERKNINIYIGLSGGVDSSVGAYLLKKDGFNVKGIYMHCFSSDDPKCRANQNRADAIKVASFLKIPIEIWDFEKEYKKSVIDYFFSEYKKGNTPNPDILCNSEIKFKLFLNQALEKGADYVATGHYAKILYLENGKLQNTNSKQILISKPHDSKEIRNTSISNNNIVCYEYSKLKIKNLKSHNNSINDKLEERQNHYYIASGEDMWKDQSYFLSKVQNDVLNKILFPLGELYKNKIKGETLGYKSTRKIANSIRLPVCKKPDSTGICFLDGIDFQQFLRTKLSEKEGNVYNLTNQKIGTHKGICFYTIGQRHDFVIKKYIGKPLYVIRKDIKKNRLYVGTKENLYKNKLSINSVQLKIPENSFNSLVGDKKIFVRIRNLGDFCHVISFKKNKNNEFILRLEKPLFSIAPGQFAVFYYIDTFGKKNTEEKIIIGSGVIF